MTLGAASQPTLHLKPFQALTPTHVEDEEVEVDEGSVDDEAADAFQLAHNGARVLQGEGQVLALLQGRIPSFTSQLCKVHVAWVQVPKQRASALVQGNYPLRLRMQQGACLEHS